MARICVALATLLVGGVITTSADAGGFRSANGFRFHDPLRPSQSTFCRVTGTDAQGVQRSTTIRVDGDRSWANVQETALAECRAGYRLNNCVIVNCN